MIKSLCSENKVAFINNNIICKLRLGSGLHPNRYGTVTFANNLLDATNLCTLSLLSPSVRSTKIGTFHTPFTEIFLQAIQTRIYLRIKITQMLYPKDYVRPTQESLYRASTRLETNLKL